MEVKDRFHDFAALLPRKAAPVPTEQEAGQVLEPVCTLWRRDKFFVPVENRTKISRSSNPYPTHCLATLNKKKVWGGMGENNTNVDIVNNCNLI
jgi:hypothetical protein